MDNKLDAAVIVMQTFGLCNVPFTSIACKTEITALCLPRRNDFP